MHVDVGAHMWEYLCFRIFPTDKATWLFADFLFVFTIISGQDHQAWRFSAILHAKIVLRLKLPDAHFQWKTKWCKNVALFLPNAKQMFGSSFDKNMWGSATVVVNLETHMSPFLQPILWSLLHNKCLPPKSKMKRVENRNFDRKNWNHNERRLLFIKLFINWERVNNCELFYWIFWFMRWLW